MPVPVAARSAVARLLRLWVRIPPEAWIFVCCDCCVLSGKGLCDELITRPEESYRLWRFVVCDLETSWMKRPWPTGGCCAKRKYAQCLFITYINCISATRFGVTFTIVRGNFRSLYLRRPVIVMTRCSTGCDTRNYTKTANWVSLLVLRPVGPILIWRRRDEHILWLQYITDEKQQPIAANCTLTFNT